jgi:hypothetical protein
MSVSISLFFHHPKIKATYQQQGVELFGLQENALLYSHE